MELSFKNKEQACEAHFASLGKVFHICSPENFQIIFTKNDDYPAAMGILAICARIHRSVRIYTFQLMSNHLHFVLSGDENEIDEFLKMFTYRLQRHFEDQDRFLPLKGLIFKKFPVDSLDYFRMSIAYVNRNGFIVNDNYTPYTYPWGANVCYFNRLAENYYRQCGQTVKVTEIRQLFHSKTADLAKDLLTLDGVISPFSFCYFKLGEQAFHNEKQYFYYVAKKVESYKKIGDIIGEMMTYSDEDIYQIACQKSFEIKGTRNPTLLDNDSKIVLSKQLHYDYHASKKQIHRILKIDIAFLDSLF